MSRVGAAPSIDPTLCLAGYITRSHRRPRTDIRGGWWLCEDCVREWDVDELFRKAGVTVQTDPAPPPPVEE